MQFSPQKKKRKNEKKRKKKENGFIQPIIVYGLCYEMGNWFINSIRIFFIFLKMFIMQLRKNSWDELNKKNG